MRSAPTIQKVGPLVFILGLTAFSLVFVFTGCDNGPLSIDQTAMQDDGTSFFDLPYDPEAMAKSSNITVDSIVLYESYISVEDGGVVLLGTLESVELRDTDDGTDVASVDAFVVKPFSVPYDTSIVLQVTKIVTLDGDMPIIFDCGPDGLVFTNPAILLINAWEDFGKKTTRVKLYWLNENTNKWELEAELPVDQMTGQVAFGIGHFSKYGIEGGTKGGASQS